MFIFTPNLGEMIQWWSLRNANGMVILLNGLWTNWCFWFTWFQCQAAPWAGSNSGVWGTSCKEPVSTVLQSDSWNIEIQQTRKMDGFIDLLWSVDACFFSKFRDTINGLSWFFWYNPIKGRYTWSVSSNSVCTANWVDYMLPITFYVRTWKIRWWITDGTDCFPLWNIVHI